MLTRILSVCQLNQKKLATKWLSLTFTFHIAAHLNLFSNLLELPQIAPPNIYGIHILVSIFSPINGTSRILNLNLILMVLNLFCCKILYILMFKYFRFKKLPYGHQYIILIACIQLGVLLKLFLIFWQFEPHCSYKMCF